MACTSITTTTTTTTGIEGQSVSSFTYEKQVISEVSSDVFTHHAAAGRNKNDKNNKMREAIICAIINNKVPETYYLTEQWRGLKTAVDGFLAECGAGAAGAGGGSYSEVKCILKGGQGHNYDFSVVFTSSISGEGTSTTTHHVEFKFNASKVSDTPQFVSPMKPSQYMSQSYENYYYAHYLPQLSEKTGFPLPSLAEYVSQIHGNKPSCMKLYQDLYYCGCSQSSKFTNNATDIEFYEFAKSVSNESITKFIQETDLNIEMMTDYLQNTQKDKIYMLYNGVRFILQHVNMDDYKIESVVKNPEKFRYECVTKSGKKMNILLRWKNGNGIAFPAFQIS